MSKKIILGVTGSIAAYKAADIVNTLKKCGVDVTVVMTAGAERFITPLTLQTLSANRVYTDVFQEYEPDRVQHIALAGEADLIVIAPASANIIARLACGFADDMLTSICLAAGEIPKLIAPAMNTRMYDNPAVRDNLETLTRRGWELIEPRESRLACGSVGKGALAAVDTIRDTVMGRI